MGGKDRGKQQLRDRQPRQVAEKQTDNWRESFPSRGFATGLCPPVPASLGVSPTIGGRERMMVFLSLGSLLQILLHLPEELGEGESSLPNCINAPDEHSYPGPNLNVALLRIIMPSRMKIVLKYSSGVQQLFLSEA